MPKPLAGQVALVAGATRGAGRGIAIELGAAGATVYCTGRTTRQQRSPLNRPETIEETADLVTSAGGRGIAVQVDHMDIGQVRALVQRIDVDQDGRLDILVNDVWGGQQLMELDKPFWENSLENGLRMHRNAVETHIITSWHVAPMMVRRGSGLIVEITDGDDPLDYRPLFYDLSKKAPMRMAHTMGEDLKTFGVTTVALTPGFMRTEEILEQYMDGQSEEEFQATVWRDRAPNRPADLTGWYVSETPRFVGRAVVALATDPKIDRWRGKVLSSWFLATEYGFTDLNGTRPLWGSAVVEIVDDTGHVIQTEDYSHVPP